MTIAGAGGCGKTRLAAQAAAAQIERWQDGVWWVDLQGATDPSTVAEAVCVASGCSSIRPVARCARSPPNCVSGER